MVYTLEEENFQEYYAGPVYTRVADTDPLPDAMTNAAEPNVITPAPTPAQTPTPKSLFLAYPSYEGKLCTQFHESVVGLARVLTEAGIGWEFYSTTRESLVPRARNMAVALFMSKPQHTHFMFVDTDIAFRPEDVLRLLAHETTDVVGGVYPKKILDATKVVETVRAADETEAPDIVLARAFTYGFEVEKGEHQIANNLMRVSYLATGFMCFPRRVIETLWTTYPHLEYKDLEKLADDANIRFFDLFRCGIVDHEGKPRYLAEDWYFCKLVREAGMTVHVDVTINLTHIGAYMFRGSFLEYLRPFGSFDAPVAKTSLDPIAETAVETAETSLETETSPEAAE